jgi:uncharacterized membrane protein YhaH (DUF805 family)
MSFLESVRVCLTERFADFGGRARRSEFWWFALFQAIVQAVAELIFPNEGLGSILQAIIGIVVFIPYLSVLIRRLHDIDRTGWWSLLLLVPLLGILVLIFFAVQPGTNGQNRFGPDPVRTPIGQGGGSVARRD